MGELVPRSGATKERYTKYLAGFCHFANMSPEKLLSQRKADLKAEDLRDQGRMETLLKKFVTNMESGGFSTSTQQVAYAAVRSFFDQNYMPLMMRRGDYPSGKNIGHRALTKEKILKMLDMAQHDKQAEILTLKDSGLRASDVVSLKVGVLEPGLSRGDEFIPIRIITRKNRVAAKAFIGPEAVEAIKKYLDLRRRGTRAMPKEAITDDSPLLSPP